MNAFAHFPSQLHWNAQQLADAVPPRLHELYAFDARRDIAPRAAANTTRKPPARTGYLHRHATLPPFRIR